MKAIPFLIAAFALWLASAMPAGAAEPIGLRTLSVPAPARATSLAVDLWYPAGAGGTAEDQGASPLFEGVGVQRDAAIAQGRFPLVLLAHGGLRSNPNLASWIAAHLAGQGALVVMPRSPAPEAAEAAPDEVRLRPGDLTAALDAIESDPALAAHLAPGEVSAVGFFLGGASVLALAGARLDPQAYGASCDAPARGPDCAWFKAAGVDLRARVTEAFGASRRDPRVTRIVAIAPELVDSFTQASLAGINIPVTVIDLGAQAAPTAMPGARQRVLPEANAFTAFSRCTPRALKLLAEEGEDDVICREAGRRVRADLQAELAGMIDEGLAAAPAP